jgi:hypothetical protein
MFSIFIRAKLKPSYVMLQNIYLKSLSYIIERLFAKFIFYTGYFPVREKVLTAEFTEENSHWVKFTLLRALKGSLFLQFDPPRV